LLTCKEFLKELSEYLDGTCDAEIRRKLETHVTECPNCFVVYDTTKRTIQVYKGMEPQPLPADVHDRLMVALQKRTAAKPH
jgi:anti-sigma factor (TIGR02949 family)